MADPNTTLRAYQILSASVAGQSIGDFPSQEAAQEFYTATNGPLPFAKTIYGSDERMVSAFTQAFMAAFEAKGFVIRF